MSLEPVDYERVIADLEAKRAAFNSAIDSAISGIRHVLVAISGLSPSPANVGGAHVPGTAVVGQPSLTPDTFFGLGIAEAAIKYLQVVKRQQTSREITDALEAAHYHHTSQNFMNTVNTALYRRSRDEGDVIKIGRNWALSEWYPGRRRASKADEAPDLHIEEAQDGDAESPNTD